MPRIAADSPEPESLAIGGATVPSLRRFLDPAIPWVWIIGHLPNTYIEWWRTEMPLNRGGARIAAEVRHLGYDMQLSTNEFLAHIEAFRDHGIYLVHSRSRMPNTLALDKLVGSQRTRVLRENGAVLTIDLPHALETAVIRGYVPGQLARCASI